MTSLLLPKIELRVAITFSHEKASFLWGNIFLESCSPIHSGPETVEDFLNLRKETFFPFYDLQKGIYFQVNRNAILFLLEPIVTGERMIGPPAIVYLYNGESHAVSMITELPSEHSRLQDYLNLEQKYLVFLKSDALMYFNSEFISKVTEHE